MEQHPVPQNVTTFQFRLIGDMTIKQFGYLAGGAILAYICYKLPLPFFFTWPLAITAALGGIGFAFVPIEERPMDVWVLSFFKSVYNPTQYIWQKAKPTPDPVAAPTQAPTAPPAAQRAEAVVLPTAPRPTAQAAPVVIPRIVAQVAPQQPPQPLPHVAPQIAPRPTPPPAATPAPQTIKPASPHLSIIEIIQGLFSGSAKPTVAYTRPVNQPAAATWHPAPRPMPQPKPAPAPAVPVFVVAQNNNPFSWFFDMFRPPRPAAPATQSIPTPTAPPTAPPPSVTGRRMDPTEPQQPPADQAQMAQEKHMMEEAQQKAQQLETRLTSLAKELETKSASDARIVELQKQLTELMSQRNQMEEEVVKLRQQLSSPHKPPPQYKPVGQTYVQTVNKGPTVKVITSDVAVKAGLPRLTTFANVVTGIVKDHVSSLLPGVLVTVRDKDDVPLRALKTNKLGQFAASTPLPNGTYLVEVEDPRSLYTFDRVQITLNGAVMPALEIVAKSKREIERAKLEKEIFGAPQTKAQ